MQYNDNAIATDESINNMAKSYAKMSLQSPKTVFAYSEKQTIDPKLFSLLGQEVKLLGSLYDRSQNLSIKDYFDGLKQKSDLELQKLLKDFPEVDNTMLQNPVFFNKQNATANFKDFLQIDLDVVDMFAQSLTLPLKDDQKKMLFGMLNRHIDALKQLFKLMHLITFY